MNTLFRTTASVGDAHVQPLRGASDIAALLGRLIAEATPLHLSEPGGALLATRLLTHDAPRARIGFQVDADAPALLPLLTAPEALAAGYLDGTFVQFALHDLLLVRASSGGSTLQAAPPAHVLRINRRRSRRVQPPGAPMAHVADASQPGSVCAFKVLDISQGGCALLLPPGQALLQPGDLLCGTRLVLDAHTTLHVTLELLHVTCMSAEDAGMRLGCRFVAPDPATAQALQHYLSRARAKPAG
jgi:c-di-GMP-binding flagellar brake protein YcgR